MAEIPSDVFDIFYPSPISLKELSAMAVSLEIWRREVDKYRKNCALDEFNSFKLIKEIPSKTVFPDLPSMIHEEIDGYISRMGAAIGYWLTTHYEAGFRLYYSDKNHILQDFNDFVCDYNGRIDQIKTAERMMLCDRFDVDKKFVIACIYFFEDDIRRFWPHVREKITLKMINFKRSPYLYYWICYLKNQLGKIPLSEYIHHNDTVDEEMLDHHEYSSDTRRSIEYFWNRLPLDKKMRKAKHLLRFSRELFTRFFLSKLDEQQINELINEKKVKLVEHWLEYPSYDEELILQLWMRFKNMINPGPFKKLIVTMLYSRAVRQRSTRDESKIDDNYKDMINKKWTYLCCEIWNSASDNLKRSSINDILFNSRLFGGYYPNYIPDNIGILLAILSYASFEVKNKFWNSYWSQLIERTRLENFQQMMELCFENQDEISQFKRNVWAESEVIKKVCVSYLKNKCFEEVNDFVNFCCPEIQAAKRLKQQALHSVFLLSQSCIVLRSSFFSDYDKFNDFIIDAFENVDQASDFKNQLISSPFIQSDLMFRVPSHCKQCMQFVDRFVSSEEMLRETKRSIIRSMKRTCRKGVNTCACELPKDDRDTFLLWCMGSKEEVLRFKRRHPDFASSDSELDETMSDYSSSSDSPSSSDSSSSSSDYFDDYHGPFINVYDDCI